MDRFSYTRGPELRVTPLNDNSEDTTPLLKAMNDTISKDNTDNTPKQVTLRSALREGHGGEHSTSSSDISVDSPTTSDSEDSEHAEDAEEEADVAEEYQASSKGDGVDASRNAFLKDKTKTLSQSQKLHAKIRRKLESIPGIDLSESNPTSSAIEYLTASISKLTFENQMLKGQLQAARKGQPVANDSSMSKQPNPARDAEGDVNPKSDHEIRQASMPSFIDCHGVSCGKNRINYFGDVPRMFKGDFKSDHLRGQQGMQDMRTYLKKHKHLAFVVVHRHTCSCAGGKDYHRMVGYKDGRILADSPPAETELKHIALSQNLRDTIDAVAKAHPSRFKGWEMYRLPLDYFEPYLAFFVHNDTLLELADSSNLSESDSHSLKLLCTWFIDNCSENWDEARAMFKRGKVTTEHYNKLFLPEELIVWYREEDPELPWIGKTNKYPWIKGSVPGFENFSWMFNGKFQKEQWRLDFSSLRLSNYIYVTKGDGEVDVASTFMFPLRFAKAIRYENLVARGNTFWNCRKTKIIAYLDPVSDREDNGKPVTEHRYIVDYSMLKRMFPSKDIFDKQGDDLGAEAMNKVEPPDDDFLAMLPSQIHAFDLSTKEWRLIRVDRITDVTWNKDAFDRLVLPQESKELIQAAVMAQGQHLSAAPDIIAGKGQGLSVLLHGGPGTGKTLTAESIAETQERPLYRVTCGDIGTEPTEVERYLESIFSIGKAWGCVVLLDEADVFLEERNLSDQKQNAIVSVFLRLLEYYDGILILTTNRVGTFDEAFKSRIHLALRYDPLDEEQRLEIWRNFIRMLAKTKERISIEDLELNANKLAQAELNGRQIRNVLTLARYLAKFRKQMLVYKHVQDALKTVEKFDKYISDLRGPDEVWAADQRFR